MTNTDTTQVESKNNEREYKSFRFRDYKVFKASKTWYKEILSLEGVFTTVDKGLWEQARRHMNSIVCNIAAASTKLPVEMKNHLGDAITASSKIISCLDIALDLGIISSEEFEEMQKGFEDITIQLKSFIRKVNQTRQLA